jgi:hypothetical protein
MRIVADALGALLVAARSSGEDGNQAVCKS